MKERLGVSPVVVVEQVSPPVEQPQHFFLIDMWNNTRIDVRIVRKK